MRNLHPTCRQKHCAVFPYYFFYQKISFCREQRGHRPYRYFKTGFILSRRCSMFGCSVFKADMPHLHLHPFLSGNAYIATVFYALNAADSISPGNQSSRCIPSRQNKDNIIREHYRLIPAHSPLKQDQMILLHRFHP